MCEVYHSHTTSSLQRLSTKPLRANTLPTYQFIFSQTLFPGGNYCLHASTNEVLNVTNVRVCAQLRAIFGGNLTIKSTRGFVVQLQSISLSL